MVEFGAELLGVGVIEFVEDGEGAFPRVTGRLGVFGGKVGVREAFKRVGFVAAVAQVPEEVQGVLVTLRHGR